MEKHFKNKLRNHKVDWGKEELLGSMQKELSQNKSRFNRKWLWLLPLLFIGTCLGLSESDFSFGNVTDLKNTKNSDINNSKINNSESDVLDLNQAENQTTVVNPIANNSDSNHLTKTNHSSLSNNDQPKSERLNISNPKIALSKNDAIIFSDKKESIFRRGLSQSTISTATEFQKINSNTATLKKDALSNENNFSNSENREKIKPIELIPILEITALPFDKKLQLNIPAPKMNTYEPKQIKRIVDVKNSFFASSSGEVGLINRTTNFQSDDPELGEVLKLNEETVSSRVLLSTNLAIGCQHQSGWSLQSGLEYNRIVEFFKFDDTLNFEVIEYLDDRAFYFLDQNADTLFFSDSATIVNSEIRKVRHNNYHSYFNIPMEVGYRHAIGKANIFGTVGISYAFAHNSKGRELRLFEAGIREIIDNPTYNLKNRIGFKISCGAEYPLFQRTHVFMKMAYRRSPKLGGERKEQFYQSYSLGVGLKVVIVSNK